LPELVDELLDLALQAIELVFSTRHDHRVERPVRYRRFSLDGTSLARS
jgi:hypothetical protein